MKSDAIAFGIAGIAFGLIAGWVIGTQQATVRTPAAAPVAAAAPAADSEPRAALLDETKVNALKSVAEREATNPKPRIELANLYFDAEKFDEAIKWYQRARGAGRDGILRLDRTIGECQDPPCVGARRTRRQDDRPGAQGDRGTR